MSAIERIAVYRTAIPLKRTYTVSFSTISVLDSVVAEIVDADGRIGWGEVTVIEGYTPETPDGAWEFAIAAADRLAGSSLEDAKRHLLASLAHVPHAVSPFLMAVDMLEDAPVLRGDETIALPLLAPVLDHDPHTLLHEVDDILADGYRTLKAKVGFDVERDLARVNVIVEAIRGIATLRIDANQGFVRSEAVRFANGLDPEVVELFEQPCSGRDWESNAFVAEHSPVPIMLDESIYGFEDIVKAAAIPGVGYGKIELEKFGSATLMRRGFDLMRDCGLRAVGGNGAATDISSWMEACATHGIGHGAAEMHGFLKLRAPLFETPLSFASGELRIPRGFKPAIDRATLKQFTVAKHDASCLQVQ